MDSKHVSAATTKASWVATGRTNWVRFRAPKVAVEWLALLLRIPEVPGSNLGSDTHIQTEIFREFSQSLYILSYWQRR
jgi:hypothetical protein